MQDQDAVIEQAVSGLRHHFNANDAVTVGWSPGRVNLIGEYTDFNNGFVLPMPTDVGIAVVAQLHQVPGVALYSVVFDERVRFDPQTDDVQQLPLWARYMIGVLLLSRDQGCHWQGLSAVVHGNLPVGGGLSSSAALTVATSMALQQATGWHLGGVATAQLCQQVEHQFAGVMCGVLDQMACRLGSARHALFIDCASLQAQPIALDFERFELLVVNSGVSRSLEDSAYNLRRRQCAEGVSILQRSHDHLHSLRDLSVDELPATLAALPEEIAARVEHVVTENQRVLAAVDALQNGDFATLGKLMNDSHASLKHQFKVSIDALDVIVDSANACGGAWGARLTGAGFGGNAIVLCQAGAGSHVAAHICRDFEGRFERTPDVHLLNAPSEATAFIHQNR